MNKGDTSEWLQRLLVGNRKTLSKAITLAESKQWEDRKFISEILTESSQISRAPSKRIAVSGPPGVGKSTFIESLGQVIADQHSLAVLTIDPSSPQSGGSILGDKTRMEKLSARSNVFIRPSPSGRQTGGIAAATADVMSLCEIAGYEYILVETVGVGQSETIVRHLTDHFILLLLAGGGDDLQGIKRGIMELADSFLFNKADITPGDILKKGTSDLKAAIHLLRSDYKNIHIQSVSSVEEKGIRDVLQHVNDRLQNEIDTGVFYERRQAQKEKQMDILLEQHLLDKLYGDVEWLDLKSKIVQQVKDGTISPTLAAEQFLMDLFKSGKR